MKFDMRSMYKVCLDVKGKASWSSSETLTGLNELVDLASNSMCCKYNALFLRSRASAVTLSGSQAENACPFPALSADGGPPSCSPRWVPRCFQPIFAQKQWAVLR